MTNNTVVKKKNLVYLGPSGSYTEEAAEKIAKNLNISNFNRVIKASINQAIESIDNDSNNIGIVPIENSIEGIVRETIDSILRTSTRVTIIAEEIIPIEHCLISKSKDITKINKVVSIPQALAQCQLFLDRTLPQAERIATSSTSGAVMQLQELPENYAAIGNKNAAKIYGMNILEQGINNVNDNLTRFVALGPEVPSPTGFDKTSMAFTTHNKPGALVSVLSVFKENNINLSYIESRPSKKVFGDYTFFIDFEGHIEDENIKNTIGKIAPMVSFYRLLGSYPRVNQESK